MDKQKEIEGIKELVDTIDSNYTEEIITALNGVEE